MKVEKHLVLCYTTNHFREWVHDWTPSYNEEGDIVNIRLTNNVFTVQYEHKTIDYMAFTPQMSDDKLRGHRFHKIVDLMGLSDNELAFFNMYVRG